jgi:hypothetical protein
MTDKDFEFLERLYFKAKRLRKAIESEKDEEQKKLLEAELTLLDPINAVFDRFPSRIKPWSEKIDEVRHEVLLQTRGIVTLSNEIITQILLTAAK